MCLITDQKKPFIAEKDIVVYKGLQDAPSGLYAPYNPDFCYKLKTLYQTEIKEDREDWCCADNEDESKLSSLFPDWREGEAENKDLRCFAQGFHFALKRKRIDYFVCVCRCIIPKGSEYYLNPSGLGVTNQIIIDRKLSTKR